MEKQFGQNDPKIIQYVEKIFNPEDPILTKVRKRADEAQMPAIQVGKMDGLHLEVIAYALQARRAVEIGTLAGYSTIHIARALAPDGKLYTFEYDHRHAEVARQSFEQAQLQNKIEIFVGPALENLSKIEKHAPFDLVFIDADKAGYPQYLEWAAAYLRVGGAVLADNTFAFGMIADETFNNEEDKKAVEAIRIFNDRAANSGRFKATILPTNEGLTFAVKVR